jgi:hypothetical protein
MCEHVVGHLAQRGHAVDVDGRHPEAVRGERGQLGDAERRRVGLRVNGLSRFYENCDFEIRLGRNSPIINIYINIKIY